MLMQTILLIMNIPLFPAPDGVLPPLATPLSATSIQLQFADPLMPNGIITMYTLIRLTPLTTLTFTPSTLPPLTPSGYYTVTDSPLTPFTDYTYTLRVCTSGGCSTSQPVMATTFESLPESVLPPSLSLQQGEGLLASWVEPGMPNGVVQSYLLFQKTLGFELQLDDVNCCEDHVALMQLQDNDPSSGQQYGMAVLIERLQDCTAVANTSADVTFYADFTVFPYTFYQYCIVVSNNADSAFSNLSSPIRTSPAPFPLSGPELVATAINSTAIELSWGALEISELLGPLDEYIVYGKVSGVSGLGQELFRGLSQMLTVVDLLASTEYVFTVGVSNGRGVAIGNNASAMTDEGSKSCLTPSRQLLNDWSFFLQSQQTCRLLWLKPRVG